MKKSIILLIIICLISQLFAKRNIPIDVPSVFINDYEFRVTHFKEDNKKQNGGVIEVYKISTNEKIKTIIVYKVKYNLFIEKDVQDVFICKMEKINNEIIYIYNEKNDLYELNANTFKVEKKERKDF